MIRPPPNSPLFPSTPLSRSSSCRGPRPRLGRRRLPLRPRKEADEPLQDFGQLVTGHVLHDPHGGPRIVSPAAAHEDMDTVHDLAVHLDLAPLEPDVGGVVVAARGGAAGPAHADRTGLAEVLL